MRTTACLFVWVWMLFGGTPALSASGGIEEGRSAAVRKSLAGRWQAHVGRESLELKLAEDGHYEFAEQAGGWSVEGLRLILTPAEAAVGVSYRYELQENFLTLSEGDLAQPLRFVRSGTEAGLLRSYVSWVRGASWRAAEERGFRILTVLGIVLVSVLALNVLRLVSGFLIFSQWGPLRYVFERDKRRTRTVHSVALNLLKYIIYFTALGHILNEIGINYTTYIASLSVIGLAVGFGSQGLVQDIVTGFFLLFDGQFSVGDMVEISGQTGIVTEMGLRTTRIRNYLGQTVVVPNRNIAVVGNYTKGCLEAFVDIAVPPDRPPAALAARLTATAGEYYRQFPGTILEAPRNLGGLRLKSDEAFVRLAFRLWPQQQAFFEGQIVPRLRESLARAEIDNPGGRVIVFYRHPEPVAPGRGRFRRTPPKPPPAQ